MLIFSLIGIIAFRSGKREYNIARIIIGLVLMLYPYFVPAGMWVWLAGGALTGLLFVFKSD